jgi:hypothetical protein
MTDINTFMQLVAEMELTEDEKDRDMSIFSRLESLS